ncbi:hypothetical protein [uncultured Microscilla sp.]|uniref:hypothetical protein n=1 Tax=uncultured Microscilla sp. TaxID=432653 RepID=UPI00261B44C1|nr:hypothetical protein [uncultured Microscilla sp.]
MIVAIFTPNAPHLEAHNTTTSIINACVQAKSGESMNVISWEALGPDVLIAELIPLGDGPYKLTVTINRPTKQALLINVDEFIEGQCATVIIKDEQGHTTNYLDGTQLDFQICSELPAYS